MTLKNIVTAFIVGFLFAVGLNISGMTQPQKVMGFLDLFGAWDPSLVFVMVGAILVHAGYFFLIKPRFQQPVFAKTYQVPARKDLTGSLILGALLFGVGWGLGGYCPGPAITSLATFSLNPALFIVAMLVGMALYRVVENKLPLSK
jgi:uncharacterized membrane protein YedE/YeeE